MSELVIRVGIVGCGYWGPNLLRNLSEISNSTVVGVADLNQERLDHIQRRYPGTIVTKDYQELFQLHLDAVVIATPPASHYRLAAESLRHGLHVLVEKPMTLTSTDAQELIELAERQARILMVGHTFVYNPAVRALKQMVDDGEMGRVYYMDAVRASLGIFQRGLNVLWDLAPHDISVLSYLLGSAPIGVSARGMGCLQCDVEDVAYLTLTFPSSCLAHVHVSWLDPCKVRRITVVGSRKMVVFDDIEGLEKVKIYDKGVECPPYADTFGDFQFSYRYGNITIPHIRFTEPLRLECEHFLECIMTNKRPQTDGYDGLRVVKIIEAAQRSLRNGGSQEQIFYEMEQRVPQAVV